MSAQAVLFDAPGPKARRRHLILTVLGALLALGVLGAVLWKFNKQGQLDGALWKPFILPETWTQYLLPGLWKTLQAAIVSIVFAMAFGIVFGMGRLSQNKPLRWACGVIVEFFRAVPVLLMMIFTFYFLARNLHVPGAQASFWAVIAALTLYNGSVIAELVRSGVHQLPKGQGEAGLAVGLTPGQTLRSIQLPQALTAMLPALMSQLVVVLKDSALGTAITYPEVVSAGRQLGSRYGNIVAAYIIIGVIFILLNWALTTLAGRLERWINRRGLTAGKAKTGASALVEGGGAPGEFGANIADAVEEEVDDLRAARSRKRTGTGSVGEDGQ
ncbi:MAG TPA: amino acid ABC transporter permease [Intrasporangiaceae bacterium]|nr:amino acid ABC transporter permease [Intrasporangiaceae bacterium]